MPEAAYQPRVGAGTPSRALDRLAALAAWGAAAVVTGAFAWIVADVCWSAFGELSWRLLVETPRDAGLGGGLAPILVSSAMILAVCLSVSIALGIPTALLLSEFVRSEALLVALARRSLDVLAGVPSIVFGLFGNALFCVILGMGFSILSGGLTLACMVLPVFIRVSEEALRAVPDAHRISAAALGMSKTGTILRVLLPGALPGLVAGFTLALGRALGETAALLYTSGYVDRMPESLLDSGRALSVHVYELSMNVPGGEPRAYASAAVLLAVVAGLNFATLRTRALWIRTRQLPD